jgi:7-carboxy-7-deazaguanine synthase
VIASDAQSSLRITEIFYSLQGETSTVGLPTVFVRLTGCPLRCGYCDTAYAFQGGQRMTLDSILNEVAIHKPRYVTVTGGEPLAQPECLQLLTALCDAGYVVSLETSGALSVADVDPRVIKIVDLKTPASGESSRNDYGNVDFFLPHDQVKFVICDRADYDWSVSQIQRLELVEKVSDILFSPGFEQLTATQLADWILADHLPVRLQLQLHKLLWQDARGK